MPGFNIEIFKSEINAREGLMRNNKFLMTFPAPRVMVGSNVPRILEYYCEVTSLPGYQLMQHDVRRWVYGPVEKRPFAPNFQTLQCAFLSDGKGDVWQFFNTWLQKIMPHDTPRGMNSASRITGAFPYELEYKQEYVTDLDIVIYDAVGNPKIRTICREAFPSQIVDMPFAWGETGNISRFAVNFEYLDWYSADPNITP